MTNLEVTELETGEGGFEGLLRRRFLAAHDALRQASVARHEAEVAYKEAIARHIAAAEDLRQHGVDASLLVHGISRVYPVDDHYEMVEHDHPNAI